MNSGIIITIIVLYFILLYVISYFTSRNANNDTFFSANHQSKWYVVAFGMIGGSLSAVTFMSVPGAVTTSFFSYMQMVFGYFFGYLVITHLLLPLYYKLNLTSIYSYLEKRFGKWSYKLGAISFLVSRMIGSSVRMYLVILALDRILFKSMGWDIPFGVTVFVTIALVWLYTNKGGIKTIVWTDTLQTTFMVLAVIITIVYIAKEMDLSMFQLYAKVQASDYSKIFFWEDMNDKKFFLKNFLGGAFITIAMTGLDQDMMQKNLTCHNLKEAQKNMRWFSFVLVAVNYLFLFLGAVLFIYAAHISFAIPEKTDLLFPALANSIHLPQIVSIFFVIGLISIVYSSSDSSLTAMTTSFCYDIIDVRGNSETDIKLRKKMHMLISLVSVAVIVMFKEFNKDNVINELFKVAGYTYGPLLGLFSFGIFSKRLVKDSLVPFIFIISPLICYFLEKYSKELFNGYEIGFELLPINGLITIFFLMLISNKKKEELLLDI